jgi:cell division protease FtsH
LFGGRLAEEVIFGTGKVTTGASNDIQKATEIARNMVTKWGLSEKVGPLTLDTNDEEVFLGHSITRHKDMSEATSSIVDAEVRSIIERNYDRAEQILRDNIKKLHTMAEALIKYETIGQDQIQDIMAERPIREPASWRKDAADKANKQAEEKIARPIEPETIKLGGGGNEGTASENGTSVN